MRQIRQQKVLNHQFNKENENNQMNLPALNNKHCQARSKHDYMLNLNNPSKNTLLDEEYQKKTYLQLCNRKKKETKFIEVNNSKKMPSVRTKKILTISTARLDYSDSPLEDAYMSHRERSDVSKKSKLKSLSNVICPILAKHKITVKMRAKMIDWLLQIAEVYQLKNQTLFLAINLMDEYFRKSNKNLEVQELHSIGITCVFMASKYQEIHPLQINRVYKDIGHGKISVKSIIQRQAHILKTLNFYISRSFPYIDLQQLLYFFRLSNKIHQEQLKSLSYYFLKVAAIDPSIYHESEPGMLGKACIMASVRSLSDPLTISLYDQFSSICGPNGEDYQKLHEISSQILFLTVNLSQDHADLETLTRILPAKLLKARKMVQSCAL